jgi:hypothetical protein
VLYLVYGNIAKKPVARTVPMSEVIKEYEAKYGPLD